MENEKYLYDHNDWKLTSHVDEGGNLIVRAIKAVGEKEYGIEVSAGVTTEEDRETIEVFVGARLHENLDATDAHLAKEAETC